MMQCDNIIANQTTQTPSFMLSDTKTKTTTSKKLVNKIENIPSLDQSALESRVIELSHASYEERNPPKINEITANKGVSSKESKIGLNYPSHRTPLKSNEIRKDIDSSSQLSTACDKKIALSTYIETSSSLPSQLPMQMKQSINESSTPKDSLIEVKKLDEKNVTNHAEVLTSHSVNKKEDSNELVPTLLSEVTTSSKIKENPNTNVSLPLSLKAFSLASFSREQILSLPIAFAYTPNDVESQNRAKIAQANFLGEKCMHPPDKSGKSIKRSLPSETTQIFQNYNKKSKFYDINYSGPAPGYPHGWKLIQKKRLNGKAIGAIDRWWFSPKTEKLFRSKKGVERFLKCLDMTDDEDKAYIIFKQNKNNGVIS